MKTSTDQETILKNNPNIDLNEVEEFRKLITIRGANYKLHRAFGSQPKGKLRPARPRTFSGSSSARKKW